MCLPPRTHIARKAIDVPLPAIAPSGTGPSIPRRAESGALEPGPRTRGQVFRVVPNRQGEGGESCDSASVCRESYSFRRPSVFALTSFELCRTRFATIFQGSLPSRQPFPVVPNVPCDDSILHL